MQPQTVAYAPDPAPAADLGGPAEFVPPPVAFPAGASASDVELQPLLRRRLLYTATLTAAAYTFYALTTLAELAWSPAAVANRGTSLVLSALTAVVAAAMVTALARFKATPVRALRALELGGVASIVLWDAHVSLVNMAWATPALLHAGTFYPNADVLLWCLHVCVYGGLIPNTARRAALVAGGMSALGAATMLFAWSRLDLFPGQLLGWVNNLVLFLGVALGFAVFNAARLEGYRRAVLVARDVGQYRLGRRLGAGGMGEVYLARHRLMKRPCAVKLLRPERTGDPAFAARFEREVAATARLNHPAAVQVYDYGRAADGTFYYVMEYLPGLTLEEVVGRAGPLPPGRAAHVLRQVCGAARAAHRLGLVHRDVKSGNIMLCRFADRADVAKLLDLGLVAEFGAGEDGRLTQAGNVLGTPAYMSPEQARGADVGPASDLYSLGAVGYFLLTGRPPFAGRSPLEVLHAHTSAAVVPPAAVRPGVPADLEAVILRLLRKDPAARYGDAAAVESALAACGCAGQWSEADAAGWWAGQPPEVPDGPGAPGGGTTADQRAATPAAG
jgi:eukaryotic-like serine/threonine-protein kinase